MASPDYSDGCMIALYPPGTLAADLAVPGGLPPDEMHVTVAYLGPTADIDRDSMLAAAQALSGRPAIEANISGHARFTGGEADVFVALVDSADLEDLRRDALEQLASRGIDIPRDHGYTPHLTITYQPPSADAPVGRLDARPVTFGAVSAVYGTERINFPLLPSETTAGTGVGENATIRLSSPKGIWRPVYAHRKALHATAADAALAAWKQDIHGLDLSAAAALLTESRKPPNHRREAAAAAVLSVLASRPWKRTRHALASAAKRSHRAGWTAGRHIVLRDRDDDTPYDDSDGEGGDTIGQADMSDHNADGTAAAALTTALAATARRAGRAMADSSNPEGDGEDTVDAGDDLQLAADVVVSAAYGAGLLAAYLSSDVGAVEWITAGDERVCDTCLANEAGNPYSLYGAPRLPAHPRCRCVLAPA